MIKCKKCGRTIQECWEQVGGFEMSPDTAFICNACKNAMDAECIMKIQKRISAYELRKILDNFTDKPSYEEFLNERTFGEAYKKIIDHINGRIKELEGEEYE